MYNPAWKMLVTIRNVRKHQCRRTPVVLYCRKSMMQAASRCMIHCGSCNWFGDYDVRLDLISISEHIHMTVVLEHSDHRVTCKNGISFAQWWCSGTQRMETSLGQREKLAVS